MPFLITTKEEMQAAGIEQFDFVYICGDAYVDHPSFGCAIITRTLEAHGYTVGIISQPDWHKEEEFLELGIPKLAFLVSSGNIDSMVNHYTVAKKRRSKDMYSDNGEMGKRPDRAVIVYCQILRRITKDVPILIGGIEASLRRFAHYDYWDNKVRHSILIDSQADLLMYGMSENCIVEIAEALSGGLPVQDIIYIRGTCWKTRDITYVNDAIQIPSYTEVCEDKRKYCEAYCIQHENISAITAKTLIEKQEGGVYVVQNPPAFPLTQQEMDFTYSLPYMRTFHPKYKYVPAIEEVRFSLVSNRGCFGSCSFCAITHHQGRAISTRSEDNIVEEAIKMTQDKHFKGYIHDVGGPTANFQQPSCKRQKEHGTCPKRECLHPTPCRNLEVSHKKYVSLLRRLRKIPKVKKVFIRSGIRYDYLMYDKDPTFFEELVKYHVSGQLKVAPEHVSPKVLDKMGKPNRELYDAFCEEYERLNKKFNMNQFLVPYLISSHPGSTLTEAIELAQYLKKIHHTPEQVQDFYPTPMTRSTCMYYTGIDPMTMEEVYVARDPEEKAMQRALMQFTYPQNYDKVYKALQKAGRLDLVGYGEECLIKPRKSGTHHDRVRSNHTRRGEKKR
ncbi:MAG: YgiQ family radical SAM protein [Erysipelotrichaceae bacterium]|nr:YgiQ family radical SAM protein [Erysipelotrichaceae bacterium]